MYTISNPFQQNSVTFCLEIEIKFKFLDNFAEYFENISQTIVCFEAEETEHVESKPDDLWKLQIFFDEYPDIKTIDNDIKSLAKSLGFTISSALGVSEVDDKDWVSEVQKTFTPILAGEFFIHHSEFKEEIPNEKIAIEINAGRAFGTGEHETTGNCLKALSSLKQEKFINCLDMGCGSGILAIAMAKLWPNQVTAVDIDDQAVEVSQDNVYLNKVGFITVAQSAGFQSKLIENNAPYQLIVANILANPLIEMAHDAYMNLLAGGKIILAGFINNQTQEVIKAYELNGFVVKEIIAEKDWPAVILEKA
jgi:ribosomal protein L11 methyltransferase